MRWFPTPAIVTVSVGELGHRLLCVRVVECWNRKAQRCSSSCRRLLFLEEGRAGDVLEGMQIPLHDGSATWQPQAGDSGNRGKRPMQSLMSASAWAYKGVRNGE